ncbi:DNA-packaging protein [Rhizobium leguminosarum]
MAAPKGNQFWKVRSSHGRNPIFATPDQLWKGCSEYFEWVEKNPLQESQAFAYQGEVKIQQIPKMRAMTITGLCIFLDIATVTWNEYRTKEGFSNVTTRAEDIIRSQKFEGASAGLLNANIIARDLGLADKNELTGKGGDPVQIIISSQDANLL